jgi:hypothetical protein
MKPRHPFVLQLLKPRIIHAHQDLDITPRDKYVGLNFFFHLLMLGEAK